jgi:hypothetical protein
VHTSTAIAAARGTYFIVWIESDRTTGMANIGDKGDVAFTAGGEMIVVKPGYYSIAVPGTAPSPPALIDHKRPEVRQAVEVTDLRDSANDESVKTVLSHHAPDVTLPTTQPLLWADRTIYTSVSSSDGTSSPKLLGGVLTSSQTFTSVNATVTTVGQAVGSTVGQVGIALGSTVTGVGSTVGQLSGTLGSTVTGIGSTVGQIGAALSPTVTAVAPALSPTVTAIVSTVPAITAPVVTTIGSVITPLSTTVPSAVSATLVPATSILGKLK